MALTKISRSLLDTGVSDSSDATAITISSSEQVMIGTTDAGYPDYGDSLTVADVDGGGGNAGMTIRSGTSSYGTFYFSDATGTAAGTYAGKMQYNHSNNSMVFGTNSSDRLTIDSSGNVGIGETTPLGKLHIKSGDSGASSVSGDKDELVIENNSHSGITTLATDSTESGIFFGHTSDTRAGEIYTRYDTTTMTIGTRMSSGLVAFLSDNGSERMRIVSSGNVGIGTTSPDRLLHVKGSASTVAKFASTGNTVYIELNAADQAGADAGYIAYNNTKDMAFWTDDTERIIVDSSGNLKPKTDAGYSGHSDLGTSSLRYEDAFVRDGVTTGSDRNEKENITESNLGLTFIKELQPVSYTWKNNSSNRTHYGLIAQDIETWLSDNDKSNTDFAALIKEDISEEQDGSNYRYGLRYTEFISPLIKAIQELSAKVEELESKINE